MNLIFLTLTALLILINLAGLGIAASRFVGHHGIARFAGLAVVVTCLFFIEHFIGLGSLTWLWPITTAASLAMLYRDRESLRANIGNEILFFTGFFAAFTWRLALPDLHFAHSEAITDLTFVANYFQGERLPPTDHWMPPFRFDYYYGLQHYAAALMGRLFGLDLGTTYNLALCITSGFFVELGWSAARHLGARVLPRILLVIALMMGGTGIAPFEPFLWNSAGQDEAYDARMSVWHNTRFIGLYDQRVDADIGQQLIQPGAPNPQAQELPLETVGYLLTLQGDFHPPLGGFLLLIFALALMALMQSRASRCGLVALLGFTVPLSLAVNTWVFPFQALLTGGWVLYRYWIKQPFHLGWLIAGASAGMLLLYPFLSGFATGARSLGAYLVPDYARSPVPQFLLLHWPWLVLSALALIGARWRGFAVYLVLTISLFMLLSELIYIGDGEGRHLRFNTTLKWWSWLHVGIVVGLGGLALASRFRSVRGATAVVLLLLNVQAIDLGSFLIHQEKSNIGRFNAAGTLADLPAYSDLLFFLRQAPDGIVLERPVAHKKAYMASSTVTLLAGHQAFIGWPGHLRNWGRPHPEINRRVADIEAFYSGTHASALNWLLHSDIRYIVWTERDNRRAPEAFEKVRQQLGSHYIWHEFRGGDPWRTGVWARLNNQDR